MKEFNKAEQAKAPKDWDETCVLGHCGSPGGCERDMQCRANLAPQPTASSAEEREAYERALAAQALKVEKTLDAVGMHHSAAIVRQLVAAVSSKPPAGEQK